MNIKVITSPKSTARVEIHGNVQTLSDVVSEIHVILKNAQTDDAEFAVADLAAKHVNDMSLYLTLFQQIILLLKFCYQS